MHRYELTIDRKKIKRKKLYGLETWNIVNESIAHCQQNSIIICKISKSKNIFTLIHNNPTSNHILSDSISQKHICLVTWTTIPDIVSEERHVNKSNS